MKIYINISTFAVATDLVVAVVVDVVIVILACQSQSNSVRANTCVLVLTFDTPFTVVQVKSLYLPCSSAIVWQTQMPS